MKLFRTERSEVRDLLKYIEARYAAYEMTIFLYQFPILKNPMIDRDDAYNKFINKVRRFESVEKQIQFAI